MKQFCLYLLCYLAGTAQINYSHLPHSIHYSSCKHISQMKCRRAHLAFSYRWRAPRTPGWVFGFPTRCKQSIKETQCHLRDVVPAASSADSCLPGSLNVWDLSVSISQLISLVHLAAAAASAAPHPFWLLCLYLLTPSHVQDTKAAGGRGREGGTQTRPWRPALQCDPHLYQAEELKDGPRKTPVWALTHYITLNYETNFDE